MDDELRRRLQRAAEVVPEGQPDLGAVARAGRRSRVTRLAGSLTLAAILAVTAALAGAGVFQMPKSANDDKVAATTRLDNDCNGELAYSVSSADSYLGIRLSRSDGSNQCWLIEEPATSPAWSPDGTMIAFYTDITRTVDIVDLRQRQRWTVVPHAVQGLTWSPDSSTVAYAGEGMGADLFAVPAEGGEPQQLTSTGATEMQPTWSPTGETIAFASDAGDGTGSDIYTVAADGGETRAITNEPGHDFAPAWSPDGRHLAFSTTRHDQLSPDDGPYSSEIYVVRSDGTEPKRLTSGDTHKERPQWSPNGRSIAYLDRCDDDVCTRDSEIALVSRDGSSQRFLTSNGDSESAFSWGPQGKAIGYVTRLDNGTSSDVFVSFTHGGSGMRLTRDEDFEDEIDWCICATELPAPPRRGAMDLTRPGNYELSNFEYRTTNDDRATRVTYTISWSATSFPGTDEKCFVVAETTEGTKRFGPFSITSADPRAEGANEIPVPADDIEKVYVECAATRES